MKSKSTVKTYTIFKKIMFAETYTFNYYRLIVEITRRCNFLHIR